MSSVSSETVFFARLRVRAGQGGRAAGGRYGADYAGRTAEGFLDACSSRTPLQQTHFPGAIPIDYYAADTLPITASGLLRCAVPTTKLVHDAWEGEVLQMIHEMKRSLSKVTDTDAAWKQINYFTNNQDRMDYARYRDLGWPIGSVRRAVQISCRSTTG